MPQSHKKAYILLWCCFTAYLAVIFRLTVFRTGFSFAAFGRGGTWNLVPLYDLWVTLRDDGFRVFARLFFWEYRLVCAVRRSSCCSVSAKKGVGGLSGRILLFGFD